MKNINIGVGNSLLVIYNNLLKTWGSVFNIVQIILINLGNLEGSLWAELTMEAPTPLSLSCRPGGVESEPAGSGPTPIKLLRSGKRLRCHATTQRLRRSFLTPGHQEHQCQSPSASFE